eukprot:scaffold627_cov125-Cylindrotheca_fusiformis.AAC.7
MKDNIFRRYPKSMPKVGSRKSPRRKVLAKPEVIKHRLLLGPTLAERKARKRRRERSALLATVTTRQALRSCRSKERNAERTKVFRTPNRNNSFNPNRTHPVTPDKVSSRQTGDGTTGDSAIRRIQSARNSQESPGGTNPGPIAPGAVSSHAASQATSRSSKKETEQVLGVSTNKKCSNDAKKHHDRKQKKPRKPPMRHHSLPSLREGGQDNPSEQRTELAQRTFGLARSAVNPRSVSFENNNRAIPAYLLRLKRREVVVNIARHSSGLSNTIASTRLLREEYEGYQMEPAIALLLHEAESRGKLLLSKILMTNCLQSTFVGGLGFSYNKSTLIVERIILCFGDLIGRVEISFEALLSLGISLSDSLEIVPFLRAIGDGIREASLSCRQLIRICIQESQMTHANTQYLLSL